VRTLCCAPCAVSGLYCVGWLKRGPSGIIGTNIADARETTSSVLADADASRLPPVSANVAAPGLDGVLQLLESRGRRREDFVDWHGYKRIDAAEVQRGAALGKPREKLASVDELLRVAKGV
jgi:adrenodoxin-NADP+ reductase